MRAWHDIVRDTLKANQVRLVAYVPDNVLKPLIAGIDADLYFKSFPTAREEEAVGIVAGAWMGGMRGIVLMQTSGFATLANVLASLPVAFQIPVLMMVSERGTLGEFNLGQALVYRTMRPILDALGRAVADRSAHRRRARGRHHRARPGGDLRPLHARSRRSARAGGVVARPNTARHPFPASDRRRRKRPARYRAARRLAGPARPDSRAASWCSR